MALVPKIPTKGVINLLKSPEVVAVASALFIVPLVQPTIENYIDKIPFLTDHATIAFVVVGIVFFIIAIKMKSGIFRAIIIGAGGSFFLLGVIPQIRKVIGR